MSPRRAAKNLLGDRCGTKQIESDIPHGSLRMVIPPLCPPYALLRNGKRAIAKADGICQKCLDRAAPAGTRMFQARFAPVEAALVRSYGVPTGAVGAFRAKLTGLQKQGLLGSENMPGKGKALTYGPDQLHRLIFSCELFEFGVAPAVVISLVNDLWEQRLRRIFREAERAAIRDPSLDDIIFYMGGVHLMTVVWEEAIPNVNSCPLRKLPDHMLAWMRMGPAEALPPRALVTNLSMRLRTFHAAFAETYLADAVAEGRAAITAKPRKARK